MLKGIYTIFFRYFFLHILNKVISEYIVTLDNVLFTLLIFLFGCSDQCSKFLARQWGPQGTGITARLYIMYQKLYAYVYKYNWLYTHPAPGGLQVESESQGRSG